MLIDSLMQVELLMARRLRDTDTMSLKEGSSFSLYKAYCFADCFLSYYGLNCFVWAFHFCLLKNPFRFLSLPYSSLHLQRAPSLTLSLPFVPL